jgi:hypothetical protein
MPFAPTREESPFPTFWGSANMKMGPAPRVRCLGKHTLISPAVKSAGEVKMTNEKHFSKTCRENLI